MFRQLRTQFILTIMSIISVILIMSFAAIYMSAANSLARQLDVSVQGTATRDFGDGVVDFFQQQREAYAQRTMSDLLLTLMLSGVATLIAVYFVSRYIADQAITPIEEAYERQRQFVADASHELKTPIAIIGANVDAAIADSGTPSRWLENIRSEVDHSGRLVDDLLALAKFDTEQTPVTKKRFDVAQVSEELVEQFAILAADKQIRVVRRIDSPLYVVSDEERLRQVLSVLLDNAIKHTKSGGRVTIAASRTKDHVRVRVENTHAHIPSATLQRLFERFYQADDSHTDKGTGLGLAIAQKISTHMKWQLKASSAKGVVVFSLTVPR